MNKYIAVSWLHLFVVLQNSIEQLADEAQTHSIAEYMMEDT